MLPLLVVVLMLQALLQAMQLALVLALQLLQLLLVLLRLDLPALKPGWILAWTQILPDAGRRVSAERSNGLFWLAILQDNARR